MNEQLVFFLCFCASLDTLHLLNCLTFHFLALKSFIYVLRVCVLLEKALSWAYRANETAGGDNVTIEPELQK